jgi:DNA-binding MarR family transcriptional regulator
VLNIVVKEGAITAGRMAMLQGVHKSAVSNRLKKLLDKELLQIKPSVDKREKVLEITDQGRKVVERSNEVLYAYIEKLMSDHVDDQEIEQFLMTFRKLKQILKMNGV